MSGPRSGARERRLIRRLVRAGRLEPEAVSEAAELARSEGGTLVQRLIDLGHVGEETVAEALLAEGAVLRRIGIALGLAAAAAALAFGGRALLDALAPPRTELVRPADLEGTFVGVGEVRAARERRVAAAVLGRVREVVEEGVRVERGAPLVRLDAASAEASLALARARIDALRAERDHLAGPALAAAEAALAVRRAAAAEGRAGEAELREAELREAEAQVARLRSEARAKSEALREAAAAAAFAEDEIRELTVPAPIAGTVVRRHIGPDEIAPPGVPILELADLDELQAEVRIAESEVAALDPDAPVELEIEAFPGRRFRGRLVRVADAGAASDKLNLLLEEAGEVAYLARMAIADPPPGLKLGMSVTARFRGRRAAALSIPREAVFYRNGERSVRVSEGGVPVVRAIKVGLDDGRRVEVVAGLAEGDRVYLER